MGDLEPVRNSAGYLLLELLALNGWRITVLRAPDGDGVTVTETRFGYRSVSKTGPSVADVAVDLVKEATGATRPRRRAA